MYCLNVIVFQQKYPKILLYQCRFEIENFSLLNISFKPYAFVCQYYGNLAWYNFICCQKENTNVVFCLSHNFLFLFFLSSTREFENSNI